MRDSPEMEEIIKPSDNPCDPLEDMQLDPNQHRFICPDVERPDLEQLIEACR